MSSEHEAGEALDAYLRAEFDEDTEHRILTAWAVVGMYEDMTGEEDTFVATTGSGNVATNIGLLRLGERFLTGD